VYYIKKMKLDPVCNISSKFGKDCIKIDKVIKYFMRQPSDNVAKTSFSKHRVILHNFQSKNLLQASCYWTAINQNLFFVLNPKFHENGTPICRDITFLLYALYRRSSCCFSILLNCDLILDTHKNVISLKIKAPFSGNSELKHK